MSTHHARTGGAVHSHEIHTCYRTHSLSYASANCTAECMLLHYNNHHQIISLYYYKKIKDKTYKLNNKDIALINLLKREKIDLPGSLAKFVYNQRVYIPNDIFNALEKKSNDDALLKTLIFLGNLNEKNDNYTRDILSIVKVFDKIKQNNFKEIFIINEFSL